MQSKQRNQDVNTRPPLQIKAEGAILGAAVGDALGWPEEGRATRATRDGKASAHQGQFISWARKAGGRFYSHEEEIKRGEYSDDTQLIVATARSLVMVSDWYRMLTEVELPFWSAYERGGGGATKRAVAAWLSGKAPWTTPAVEQRKYFDAGGNGVVMRILPHCLWESRSSEFSSVASAIVKNGITTHGHPRALVGALAYGFAAWHQLRSAETLGYGALLDLLLDTRQVWSSLPEILVTMSAWRESADASAGGPYVDLWAKTVDEQLSLFETAKAGMAKGALAIDQEVLHALGCFDKRVNGSGTIAAASAVFLTSRYAADPLNGLREAAYSRGADTDTLASLVGGLLGIVNGLEWLGSLAGEVQDSDYLRFLAHTLCERKPTGDLKRSRIADSVLSRFLHGLPGLTNGQSVTLPDGQEAKVDWVSKQPVGGGKTDRVVVHCRTAASQTLYLKTFLKSVSSSGSASQRSSEAFDSVKVERVVVRLRVRDLDQAKRFYVSALGMEITKESPGLVTLAGVLALSSREAARDQHLLQFGAVETQPMHVYVETKDLDVAYRNILNTKGIRLSDITSRDNRRSFSCNDPDGNVVEVLEPRA